jgi:hypothetical protein
LGIGRTPCFCSLVFPFIVYRFITDVIVWNPALNEAGVFFTFMDSKGRWVDSKSLKSFRFFSGVGQDAAE